MNARMLGFYALAAGFALLAWATWDHVVASSFMTGISAYFALAAEAKR